MWIVTWSVYLTPLLFAINHFIIFRTNHHLFKPSTRRRHHSKNTLTHSWWYGSILVWALAIGALFVAVFLSSLLSIDRHFIYYTINSILFHFVSLFTARQRTSVRHAMVGVVFISIQHFKFVGHVYSIICSMLCDCFERCGVLTMEQRKNQHTNAPETAQVLVFLVFVSSCDGFKSNVFAVNLIHQLK